MTSTINHFHYQYEDTIEESVEGLLAIFSEQIGRASKWRPSIPLLSFGGVCGGLFAVAASSVSGKLIGLLLPILLVLLLTISSKQTRIDSARQQIELFLRKNYNEKKCHVHDFSIDPNGLVETCPCGTITRNWQAIMRWNESERMIVLQASNKSCYGIPKRVIPAEELQPLRDFLSQHIQPVERLTT